MTNSQAWDYAVGMIKVDGLEPTPEFKEYIEKEKRGEVTMADIKHHPVRLRMQRWAVRQFR